VQLLARGTHDEREQKRLGVALDEVARMQHILDEYLSFARAPGEISPRPVSLDTLLRDIVLLVEPSAASQGVSIELTAEPLTVSGDPTRLKDAILNLVGNALAAMPAGGALRLALERDATAARIVISDNGTGMNEEQLAQAGTPFVTHRAGGTGLGLALARGVARQHGGDLDLESAPRRGTRATLSIALYREERS
jgi:signal transduction histidine kinase